MGALHARRETLIITQRCPGLLWGTGTAAVKAWGVFLVLMDVSSTVVTRRRSSVSRETMTLGPRPAIVGWGFSIWSGGVVVRQLYCRHQ